MVCRSYTHSLACCLLIVRFSLSNCHWLLFFACFVTSNSVSPFIIYLFIHSLSFSFVYLLTARSVSCIADRLKEKITLQCVCASYVVHNADFSWSSIYIPFDWFWRCRFFCRFVVCTRIAYRVWVCRNARHVLVVDPFISIRGCDAQRG